MPAEVSMVCAGQSSAGLLVVTWTERVIGFRLVACIGDLVLGLLWLPRLKGGSRVFPLCCFLYRIKIIIFSRTFAKVIGLWSGLQEALLRI